MGEVLGASGASGAYRISPCVQPMPARRLTALPRPLPARTPPPRQTIARRIPSIAYFTTLAIRFANNVVGGENFIDMARWAGVQ